MEKATYPWKKWGAWLALAVIIVMVLAALFNFQVVNSAGAVTWDTSDPRGGPILAVAVLYLLYCGITRNK